MNLRTLLTKASLYIILSFLIFINYKFFYSTILQSILIKDYNTSSYTINPSIMERFDLSIPNITQTTIPMKLLKGRYYINEDSIQEAIKLFKESLKINPYLKMAEGELSFAYFKLKEYDSAYYYAREAFRSLPDNNTHRRAYFQSLVQRQDSVELMDAFELIKKNNNRGNWLQYLLARKAISKKNTPEIDSLFIEYKNKFNLESDIETSMFQSRLFQGNLAVTDAVEISNQAQILYNEKKYLEAAKNYELSIQINPYDYTFYQNAALAYANTEETDLAIKYFDKVIYDFQVQDGKAHFYKGILLLKLNNKMEGCENLRMAVNYKFSGQGSYQMYQTYCR